MTKKQIHTIELQEEEIKRLRKENKSLWRGKREKNKIIERLMKENRVLSKRENALDGVNV